MARVLIAIGRQDVQERLCREIEAEGHDVTMVDRGDEVMDEVLRQLPQMVILGAALAVFDGYETCAMLRADPDVPSTLPIILVVDRDFDRRKLERAEFTGTLSSETDANALRENMTRWLSV
jgi:DNA-binding response OmpR family regulator